MVSVSFPGHIFFYAIYCHMTFEAWLAGLKGSIRGFCKIDPLTIKGNAQSCHCTNVMKAAERIGKGGKTSCIGRD